MKTELNFYMAKEDCRRILMRALRDFVRVLRSMRREMRIRGACINHDIKNARSKDCKILHACYVCSINHT